MRASDGPSARRVGPRLAQVGVVAYAAIAGVVALVRLTPGPGEVSLGVDLSATALLAAAGWFLIRRAQPIATGVAPPRLLVPLAFAVPTAVAALARDLGWTLPAGALSRWTRLDTAVGRELPFWDLRNLTSAVECQAQGVDVLASNPCDPLGRAFNQPRLWLSIGALLRLDQSDTEWLALVVVLCGALALWLVAGASSPFARWLLLAVALAPPAQFLAWSGNLESVTLLLLVILAWCGVSAAVRWQEGRSRLEARWMWATGAVGVVVSSLKLLPIFGLAHIAVRGRTRSVIVAATSVGLTALWLAARSTELRAIADNTRALSDDRAAFGSWVLAGQLPGADNAAVPVVNVVLVVVLMLLLLFVPAYVMARRTPRRNDGSDLPESLALCVIPIVAVAWVIALNYDYRWMVLVVALPWLAGPDAGPVRLWAAIATAVACVSWFPVTADTAAAFAIGASSAAAFQALRDRWERGVLRQG